MEPVTEQLRHAPSWRYLGADLHMQERTFVQISTIPMTGSGGHLNTSSRGLLKDDMYDCPASTYRYTDVQVHLHKQKHLHTHRSAIATANVSLPKWRPKSFKHLLTYGILTMAQK